MTSSRTSERWTTIVALFVLIGQILLPSEPARAAVGPDALLPPTPLVLKDGRIANVSIHVLPFDAGRGELAGGVASGLAELTAQVATDCFLTAQVIGHVSSREVADNETLAAHRLARARADAVQASLIGGGLPAKSIASVWDWQFLVREPRATLWVFRLIQGEDCEGLPLDGDAAQLVADNDAPEQVAPDQVATPVEVITPSAETARGREVAQAPQPVETPRPARPAPRAATHAPAPVDAPTEHAAAPGLSGMVGSASAAEAPSLPAQTSEVADSEPADNGAPVQAEGQASSQPAARTAPAAQAEALKPAGPRASQTRAGTQKTERPERVAVPAGPAPDAVPTVTRPLPALSPAQPAESSVASSDRASDTTLAAVEATRAASGGAQAGGAAAGTQQSAARQDPERQGKVEWGQDGNVVITFATNSSYFPPGTARRLKALLDNMKSGEPYRVQLEVGVSGSDTVVGASSPEEARRYNRWLAERRMTRVQEWLDDNAQDRQLEIEPAFLADDSSRRVVVRVAPPG